MRHSGRRVALAALVGAVWIVGRAAAHGGSLGGAAGRSLDVPMWLFLTTGGGVVGVSFLLASFVTDRALIRAVHDWRASIGAPAAGALATGGRTVGVVGLFGVIGVGILGPDAPLRNAAVLVVWVGWWAGLAMAAYLVGNAWPLVNPWRTLARPLPSLDREVPDGAAWASALGVLALVWIEVVSPLADDPEALAVAATGYTLVTLVGAVTFGREAWFAEVDPLSRVFRAYGRVAPLYWDAGLRVRLPGTGLETDAVASDGDVAFVVALLWGTTFDGLVSTSPWRDVATAVVTAGVPAVVLYPATLLAGFGLFYGAFRLAIRYGRRHAETYRSADDLAREFAPSLLAIAAGYHLAHYLGYFLALSPALVGALAAPLSPGPPTTLVLPGWFGALSLAFVLLGHLLAIWVAHTTAYDLFPSRLQAIRSQYALTLVMVFYTMTSLWIVSRPYANTPFV